VESRSLHGIARIISPAPAEMILRIPYAGRLMRSGEHARLMHRAAADACVTEAICHNHEFAEQMAFIARFHQSAEDFWNRINNAWLIVAAVALGGRGK
jgi:hypothetical protein